MWRDWAIFAALPIGLALAALAAPLRQALGALVGAAAVAAAAGALVAIVTNVPFAALVVGAMAFGFALVGSGSAGRWVSRVRSSPPNDSGGGRVRIRGGASGIW